MLTINKKQQQQQQTNAHNREILRNRPSKNVIHCNCRQKENYPVNDACLKESLLCHYKFQQ